MFTYLQMFTNIYTCGAGALQEIGSNFKLTFIFFIDKENDERSHSSSLFPGAEVESFKRFESRMDFTTINGHAEGLHMMTSAIIRADNVNGFHLFSPPRFNLERTSLYQNNAKTSANNAPTRRARRQTKPMNIAPYGHDSINSLAAAKDSLNPTRITSRFIKSLQDTYYRSVVNSKFTTLLPFVKSTSEQ